MDNSEDNFQLLTPDSAIAAFCALVVIAAFVEWVLA